MIPKQHILLLALSLLFTTPDLAAQVQAPAPVKKPAGVQTATYKNTLAVSFGDPYVLYDAPSKLYYMYGTGGGAKRASPLTPPGTW